MKSSTMQAKMLKLQKCKIADMKERQAISAIAEGKEAQWDGSYHGYYSLGTQSVLEEAVQEEKRKYGTAFKALDVILAQYV